MKNSALLIISLLILSNINAQNKYPKDYFIAPVKIKMALSGTFGELRSNHFHSGIDIKTGGKTGEKVYAIADAYISRIKVSGTGFGKTLYLRHPNGYTSVYAHLNSFTPEIDKLVREIQYKKKSFEINIYPQRDELKYNKGELIAYSGNSGGSEGAHLHFEIRDTHTEHPLNPLLFGFAIKDFIRPKIKAIKLYAIDGYSFINGKQEDFISSCGGWGQEHYIKSKDTITVSGNIAFGINAYDQLNDAPNKNGLYSVRLIVDSVLYYAHHLEEFSFDESRYINSLIDYAYFIQKKLKFQRSVLDPNNHLSVYDSIANNGIYNFSEDAIHEITYELADANGNISKVNFVVKSEAAAAAEEAEEEEEDSQEADLVTLFHWDEENKFSNDEVRIVIPSKALYKDISFTYEQREKPKDCYSSLHILQSNQMPLHKYYELKIKPLDLPDKLKGKAIIVKLSEDEPVSMGGKYDEDYVRVLVREFGKFAIMTDTKKPEITALNLHSGKNIRGYKSIIIQIKDDLSGIKTYEGQINGKWALFEYDPKNDRLIYYMDHLIKKGENQLKLEVEDNCDNKQWYSCTFIY